LALEQWQKTSWEEDCKLIALPSISDPRGQLSFVESNRHMPFPINRVYYIYGVPAGESRGAHAHRELHQLMVAVNGSFDAILTDGFSEKRFTLDRGDRGLLIPPMTWRNLENFSEGSVCLVFASLMYSEADYIRDHDEFLQLARAGRHTK
jgi:dTDP-4-dehydrorhamnose 3,5-epimerase-like enzyme